MPSPPTFVISAVRSPRRDAPVSALPQFPPPSICGPAISGSGNDKGADEGAESGCRVTVAVGPAYLQLFGAHLLIWLWKV
jgi:hypothetical protein